jgi:hypothetical protein
MSRVRRGLALLERYWKALWKRVEEPAEPLTLSEFLKVVALLTLVGPLMCFPVYAGMSLLSGQEMSDLRSSLGIALELVAVTLILYVLGLLSVSSAVGGRGTSPMFREVHNCFQPAVPVWLEEGMSPSTACGPWSGWAQLACTRSKVRGRVHRTQGMVRVGERRRGKRLLGSRLPRAASRGAAVRVRSIPGIGW